MSEPVTRPTERPVEEFLAAVEPARRRDEGQALDRLFREVTGFQPRMWGPTMVGYGRYAYRHDSGHAGESLATGFSPRKAHLVVYGLPGLAGCEAILSRLGPHKRGQSCLYLTALARVDQAALADLIRAGLRDLRQRWVVLPD